MILVGLQLIAPVALLSLSGNVLSAISLVLLSFAYWLVAYQELGIFSGLLATLFLPFKIFFDLIMLCGSMALYSNRFVFWKDRNICLPMYDVVPKLPDA